MVNEKQLRKILEGVKDNDYMLPKDQSIDDLSISMLNHIGALDPILRDKMIYATFYMWIERDYFSDDQLKKLLTIACGRDHLLYGIDGNDECNVFKRSFSVLVVSLVLWKNNTRNFLSLEDIEDAYEQLMIYMSKEKDFRGHDKNYGWADTRAHLADALSELVESEFLDRKKLMNIMKEIRGITTIDSMGTVSNEGERLNAVVHGIFNRNIIGQDEWVYWIESYLETDKRKDYHYLLNRQMNVKSFLYPLYLKANTEDVYRFLIKPLENVLNSL